MSTPTQLRLDAIERALPTGRPLVPAQALMVVLDRSEDDIKYLWEAGLLRFAFDVASPCAKRKEVRVWRESVLEYQTGNTDYILRRNDAADLARAVAACVPAGNGPVPLAKLARLWTVSSTHLHDLVKAGSISALAGQDLKQTQTPALDRQSVIEFLQRRRIV